MEDYIIDALGGDHSAFVRLYDNFAPAALRLSVAITRSKPLSEDAVQEAFLRVFRKGYQYKKAEAFEPWFFRIVINESKRALKKNPEVLELDTDRLTVTFTEQTDISLVIEAALDNLSAEHRAVLVFKFLFDYSESDISKILKKPIGTIKSRIHYAKKAMLQEMNGKEGALHEEFCFDGQ